MADVVTVTCECGKTTRFRKLKSIMRDKDSAVCTCGRTVLEWNGGHYYVEVYDSDEKKSD